MAKVVKGESTKSVKAKKTIEAPIEMSEEQNEVNVEKKIDEAFKELNDSVEEKIANESKDNNAVEKEVQNVLSAVKEIEVEKETLNKSIDENPQNSEVLLKQEIKKIEEVKNNVEKIIKKVDNNAFTNYWNGQIYDF